MVKIWLMLNVYNYFFYVFVVTQFLLEKWGSTAVDVAPTS